MRFLIRRIRRKTLFKLKDSDDVPHTLIRRITRKTLLKLKDSDDGPQSSPMPMTSEVTDSNNRNIGDGRTNITEPVKESAREVPEAFQSDATNEVLQDLEKLLKAEMHRPTKPSSVLYAKKTSGREPVWKRRFRTLKASIDPETHPFDENDYPLLGKKPLYRVDKNTEEETVASAYSAPFTQSEELDRFLPIKRPRSDHYMGLEKRTFRNRFGGMRTYSLRRAESQNSDPFRNIEDIDAFSLKTPSCVEIHSAEHSYSTTSVTDLEDDSTASSYSRSSQKRSKIGFGVGKFIDAIGSIRVTETSTFADEVKNFADLVVDQAACSRCAPTTTSRVVH